MSLKPCFIRLLLLILSMPAWAFSQAQGKWIQSFEVFAGIGQIDNTGNGSYLTYNDTKASFIFGVGVNHYFTPTFDLNARLGYERKGYKYSEFYYDPYVMENRSMQIDRSIDCFSLQVLPTFKLFKQRSIRLGIGPYISVPYNTVSLVKQFDQNGNLIMQSGVNTTKRQPDVGLDFGLTAFAGYAIKVNQVNELTIQLMTSHGANFYAKASGGDVQNNINSIVLSYRYKRKIFR